MSKHTSGPWTVTPGRSAPLIFVDNEWAGSVAGELIAELWVPVLDIEQEVATANASLIAAAPDLLEAVVALLNLWEDLVPSHVTGDTLKHARAAIAKAKGRTV